MSSKESRERRRFVRIPFHSQVLLKSADRVTVCQLLDLSLKGILLEVPPDWSAAEKQYTTVLSLSPSGKEDQIEMTVTPVHQNDTQVGFRWESIGLDSFSHLKRLLEVNLADESELNREIQALRADR
jgi:hypothetical protein